MNDREWWSYREIRFTKQQVLWILKHADLLRDGCWPPEPAPSGYTDLLRIRKKGSEAYFAKPIEIIAEIEIRLEKCGLDGLILEAIECWEKTEESLSKQLNMPQWSIRKRRKGALAYVASGPDMRWHTTKKRKGKTYKEFRNQPKKGSNTNE